MHIWYLLILLPCGFSYYGLLYAPGSPIIAIFHLYWWNKAVSYTMQVFKSDPMHVTSILQTFVTWKLTLKNKEQGTVVIVIKSSSISCGPICIRSQWFSGIERTAVLFPAPNFLSIKVKMDLGGLKALKNKTGLELKEEQRAKRWQQREARDESGVFCTFVSQGAAAMKMSLVDLHLQEHQQLRPLGPHSENRFCICAKATPPMEDLLPVTCLWVAWDSYFGWLWLKNSPKTLPKPPYTMQKSRRLAPNLLSLSFHMNQTSIFHLLSYRHFPLPIKPLHISFHLDFLRDTH